VKVRDKRIVHANLEPKEKPKTKPKKASKSSPKFDIKASLVW
jgi:hypothetical protein